ncbi:hypothetical protein Esti_006355 [Eimeria stiedai]
MQGGPLPHARQLSCADTTAAPAATTSAAAVAAAAGTASTTAAASVAATACVVAVTGALAAAPAAAASFAAAAAARAAPAMDPFEASRLIRSPCTCPSAPGLPAAAAAIVAAPHHEAHYSGEQRRHKARYQQQQQQQRQHLVYEHQPGHTDAATGHAWRCEWQQQQQQQPQHLGRMHQQSPHSGGEDRYWQQQQQQRGLRSAAHHSGQPPQQWLHAAPWRCVSESPERGQQQEQQQQQQRQQQREQQEHRPQGQHLHYRYNQQRELRQELCSPPGLHRHRPCKQQLQQQQQRLREVIIVEDDEEEDLHCVEEGSRNSPEPITPQSSGSSSRHRQPRSSSSRMDSSSSSSNVGSPGVSRRDRRSMRHLLKGSSRSSSSGRHVPNSFSAVRRETSPSSSSRSSSSGSAAAASQPADSVDSCVTISSSDRSDAPPLFVIEAEGDPSLEELLSPACEKQRLEVSGRKQRADPAAPAAAEAEAGAAEAAASAEAAVFSAEAAAVDPTAANSSSGSSVITMRWAGAHQAAVAGAMAAGGPAFAADFEKLMDRLRLRMQRDGVLLPISPQTAAAAPDGDSSSLPEMQIGESVLAGGGGGSSSNSSSSSNVTFTLDPEALASALRQQLLGLEKKFYSADRQPLRGPGGGPPGGFQLRDRYFAAALRQETDGRMRRVAAEGTRALQQEQQQQQEQQEQDQQQQDQQQQQQSSPRVAAADRLELTDFVRLLPRPADDQQQRQQQQQQQEQKKEGQQPQQQAQEQQQEEQQQGQEQQQQSEQQQQQEEQQQQAKEQHQITALESSPEDIIRSHLFLMALHKLPLSVCYLCAARGCPRSTDARAPCQTAICFRCGKKGSRLMGSHRCDAPPTNRLAVFRCLWERRYRDVPRDPRLRCLCCGGRDHWLCGPPLHRYGQHSLPIRSHPCFAETDRDGRQAPWTRRRLRRYDEQAAIKLKRHKSSMQDHPPPIWHQQQQQQQQQQQRGRQYYQCPGEQRMQPWQWQPQGQGGFRP